MDILDLRSAAKFLKISESTLYRAVSENKIPCRKVGKQWRFHKDALVRWLCMEADTNKITTKNKRREDALKFIDLFCGIGGFRIAGEKNGMECVFSSDNDKFAQETYYTWYGERPEGDIMEFTKNKKTLSQIPNFDILFAGFPCQPFSYAGKNEGFEDETRGTLFFHVAKIIEFHKPKMFLLENVKGLKSHDNGKTLRTILITLKNLGYNVSDTVLNSYDFGVPQYRERWFCVGIRNDIASEKKVNFKFPQGDKQGFILADIIDSRYDKDNKLAIKKFERDRINFHFNNMSKFSGGRVVHDNSIYGENTKKGKHGVYSYLKPDKTLRFHIGDAAKTQIQEAYYVHSNTYAPAIIANRRPKLWDKKRFLSVKECMRLQAFPDYLEFPVSDAQAYKQLGNSVTVTVIDNIVNSMKEFFDNKQQSDDSINITNFNYDVIYESFVAAA